MKDKKLQLAPILMFVFSVVVIVLAVMFHDKLSQFRSLGLIGIFLINLLGSATLFLPAPAIATVVAGGILYHPLAVALVAALGAAIGDMVGFFLGKSGSKVLARKEYPRWYGILHTLFKKYGMWLILVFSIVPNPLFDAIGLIAGAFGYSAARFFIIMVIGRFIRNIILAYAGKAFGAL